MNELSVLFAVLIICTTYRYTTAQYDDVRCKCICPPPVNRTASDTKKVYVKSVPPIECECKNVVPGLPADQCAQNDFCLRCKCNYESRNTTTVKVCVVVTICIISLLLAYTAFWCCLEFLVPKSSDKRRFRLARPTSESIQLINRGMSSDSNPSVAHIAPEEQEPDLCTTLVSVGTAAQGATAQGSSHVQDNDGVAQDDGRTVNSGSKAMVPPTSGVHMRGVVKKARNQQQRWKVDVDLQRVRVYEQHSLLN